MLDKEKVTILKGIAGSGKALRHGTRIPTPDGFKRIEDFCIGDFVFTPTGKITKVIATYPQGEVDLYKVETDDGRKSYCCGEHLWRGSKEKGGKIKNYTTKEIFEDCNSSSVNFYLIPTSPACFPPLKEKLPIEPYELGKLLGGENEERKIFLSKSFSPFIEFQIVNQRIPLQYKRASVKERILLIIGLIDSLKEEFKGTIIVSSFKLAKDIREVLFSLGLKNFLFQEKHNYCIRVQLESKSPIITNIEQVEKGFATCISVEDSLGCFLTEDYLPTHNSYTISHLLDYLNYREKEVAYCAFTGAAAKVMMDNGLNASTIHSLIYKPVFDRRGGVSFIRKKIHELNYLRLIIVDEYSMLSQEILDDLLFYGVPLLLVGDHFQLPPIGEPNQYINIHHALLTEPIRQALDSPIIYLANLVRQNKNLPLGLHGNVLVDFKTKLEDVWLRPDVVIACGTNDSRNRFNYRVAGSKIPQPGHNIVFLKNQWKQNIVNGSTATLKKVQRFGNRLIIDFTLKNGFDYVDFLADWQKPRNLKNQFIDFSYARTVNKLQGSTISQPILVWDESYYWKKDRHRWLYTAITRSDGKYPMAILK